MYISLLSGQIQTLSCFQFGADKWPMLRRTWPSGSRSSKIGQRMMQWWALARLDDVDLPWKMIMATYIILLVFAHCEASQFLKVKTCCFLVFFPNTCLSLQLVDERSVQISQVSLSRWVSQRLVSGTWMPECQRLSMAYRRVEKMAAVAISQTYQKVPNQSNHP